MKNIKGIILDYGGTLDSNGVHWAHIIWDGFQKTQIPITEAQFREAYVYGERYLAQHLVIFPDFTFLDLMEAKIKIEFDFLIENGILQQSSQLQNQALQIAAICYEFAKNTVQKSRETIEKLHRQYPLVLVSNFYGNVESVLKDFHIRDYFSEIIESAVVKIRKPDPAIFALGIEALKIKPEETMVVGDSYAKDIEPAKKCGCQTCWIKGKGWDDKEEKDTTSADFILSNFEDVLTVLRKSTAN